jgi:hypothetical protein
MWLLRFSDKVRARLISAPSAGVAASDHSHYSLFPSLSVPEMN